MGEGTESETDIYQTNDDTAKNSGFVTERALRIGRTAITTVGNVRDFLKRDVVLPLPGTRKKPLKTKRQVSEDVTRLKNMVARSHEMICDIRTAFPFTLFPDEIILDRTKVTLIRRNFFWSSDVLSFRIEDVLNVSTSLGPFFGSVTISSRVMSSIDHFEIIRFWRRDAIHIKHMIQGYMIAKHSEIDLDQLTIPELVETLNELGRDSSAE